MHVKLGLNVMRLQTIGIAPVSHNWRYRKEYSNSSHIMLLFYPSTRLPVAIFGSTTFCTPLFRTNPAEPNAQLTFHEQRLQYQISTWIQRCVCLCDVETVFRHRLNVNETIMRAKVNTTATSEIPFDQWFLFAGAN